MSPSTGDSLDTEKKARLVVTSEEYLAIVAQIRPETGAFAATHQCMTKASSVDATLLNDNHWALGAVDRCREPLQPLTIV